LPPSADTRHIAPYHAFIVLPRLGTFPKTHIGLLDENMRLDNFCGPPLRQKFDQIESFGAPES
jgi:hypothetical protein